MSYPPPVPPGLGYRPDPVHLDLGDAFHDVVVPARFPRQVLRHRNQRWAERVGLDSLDDAEWLAHFAGFAPLPGNLRQPLALRYHGHQFGRYNPMLGDGRGFLYAQLRDGEGRLLDLASKGSGPTPYARGFDGRLTLQGGVRELLATEMLEALGVYTSKTFSVIETGEALERSDEPSPARGCVLVRLGHSHVRYGTFQRMATEGDPATLARLVEHCLRHYLPAGTSSDEPDEPIALLRFACARAARLAASWTVAGFVHGVVNSDNMNLTGESFDYGPWRFLPVWDPEHVAAYFDERGYYAFGRQPEAVLRNLRWLADALAPLAPRARLEAALSGFAGSLAEAEAHHLLWRLGVGSVDGAADRALWRAWVEFVAVSQVPLDQAYFDVHGGAARLAKAYAGPVGAAYRGPAWRALRRRLDHHPPAQPAALAAPFWQRDRPPLLVIDEVRACWAAIAERDDWRPLDRLLAEIRVLGAALAATPPPHAAGGGRLGN